MEDFERQCREIRQYNVPLLEEFRAWLTESGLTKKTISNHVGNVKFFGEYLLSCDPPLRLDQATDSNITMFFGFWFPRKAMWASVESTKQNIASFKKFFKWMGETGKAPADVVEEALTTLKEERGEFLAAPEEGGFEM